MNTERALMQRALNCAREALYLSSPNPSVGCVIANDAGEIISTGYTQQVGGPHAEISALNEARKLGLSTLGATVYVTLEPCAHTGRTAPCTDALIGAGIKRVVASITDPNPLVGGKGFEALRRAGIQVDIGLCAEEAHAINEGFIKRMKTNLPFCRLKIASSLDAGTALNNGVSKWITSETARAHAQHFRARSCAVLSGVGTVLSDDPRLDVRALKTLRQPVAVLIDARLQTPPEARVFEAKREVLIYFLEEHSDKARADKLRSAGATLIPAQCLASAQVASFKKVEGSPRIDLNWVLKDLGKRQINDLLIEAGSNLNTSFISEGLVDEFLIYLAPLILGPSKGWAQLPELESLEQGIRLRFLDTQRLGDDLMLRARVAEHP